jgi:hypothetical protein
MDGEYQRLWDDVKNAKDEAEAVQALAKILIDKKGRSSILGLEPKDAGLCIEILDRVGPDLRSLLFCVIVDEFVRA